MPVKLDDIARALNVSKMTVSRAINNHPEISSETRARILAMAQKMKYLGDVLWFDVFGFVSFRWGRQERQL